MSLPFWPPRCYVASVLHEAGVNDLTRYRTVARRRRQLSNRNGITPAQLSFPRESDLMHGGWCLHPPDLGATSQRRGAGQEQNRNIGHRADCIEVITRRSTSGPTTASARRAHRLESTWTSTIANVPILALTAGHRMRLTSPRHRFPKQPNTRLDSTYKSGNPVQRNRAISPDARDSYRTGTAPHLLN